MPVAAMTPTIVRWSGRIARGSRAAIRGRAQRSNRVVMKVDFRSASLSFSAAMKGLLLFQTLPDPFPHLDRGRFIGIGLASPDKSPGEKAVLVPPRDDVDVHVRDALAHPVVDRDKGAVRTERLLKDAPEFLDDREERSQFRFRHIEQRFVVRSR